jgi:hypothetical protein
VLVMLAVAELAPRVGLRSACQAFALNRGFVRLAGKRRRDDEPRLNPHHPALRSPARRDEPRRGGADLGATLEAI